MACLNVGTVKIRNSIQRVQKNEVETAVQAYCESDLILARGPAFPLNDIQFDVTGGHHFTFIH